jgi:hypothetical protein
VAEVGAEFLHSSMEMGEAEVEEQSFARCFEGVKVELVEVLVLMMMIQETLVLVVVVAAEVLVIAFHRKMSLISIQLLK